MQQKRVLGQFAARIAKAKIHYQHTKDYCDTLRKQATKLQIIYQQLVQNRKAAQNMELLLQQQYTSTKKQRQQQNIKCSTEGEKMNTLRQNTKRLRKEKQQREKQLLKSTLTLEQLVKQRQSLQNQAKLLSQKLEIITNEKETLAIDYSKTNSNIEEYTNKIKGLKSEIQSMKQLISGGSS